MSVLRAVSALQCAIRVSVLRAVSALQCTCMHEFAVDLVELLNVVCTNSNSIASLAAHTQGNGY